MTGGAFISSCKNSRKGWTMGAARGCALPAHLFAPTVRLPGDLLTSKTNKIASMLEMKSMFGGWNGHIGSAPSCFAGNVPGENPP